MLADILKAIGITNKESRFITVPKPPFIVWFHETETRGGDYVNGIVDHHVSLELYEDKPDTAPSNKIETVLNQFGLEYDKSVKNWIASESYYQTVFDFDYTEKKEV